MPPIVSSCVWVLTHHNVTDGLHFISVYHSDMIKLHQSIHRKIYIYFRQHRIYFHVKWGSDWEFTAVLCHLMPLETMSVEPQSNHYPALPPLLLPNDSVSLINSSPVCCHITAFLCVKRTGHLTPGTLS